MLPFLVILLVNVNTLWLVMTVWGFIKWRYTLLPTLPWILLTLKDDDNIDPHSQYLFNHENSIYMQHQAKCKRSKKSVWGYLLVINLNEWFCETMINISILLLLQEKKPCYINCMNNHLQIHIYCIKMLIFQ